MKHLLLDVDGVLIRDRLITKHMEHNIDSYVSKKLPKAKDPSKIRTMLFNRYGHTARGLTQAFGINTDDFNSEVYNTSLMSHLNGYIYGKGFKNDADDIHNLIQRDGWNVTLFSNAPVEWVTPIALAIDDRVNIPQDRLFLKPESGAYAQFPNKHKYVFVDDTLNNILVPSLLPNWSCIQFADKPTGSFLNVRSIWELTLMLNTISHD